MKTIDTEHPDYLFNNYIYINGIISYTINTTHSIGCFPSEEIIVEVYADTVLYALEGTEIIIFNLKELEGKKYRITEITINASYSEHSIATIEAINVYGE